MTFNPFFSEQTSDSGWFIDHKPEHDRLSRLFTERGRRILLYGRRRMGKTSLIKRCASNGQPLIHVNVALAAGMTELARQLISRSPPPDDATLARSLKIGRQYFDRMSIGANGSISFTGEFQEQSGEENLGQALHTLNAWAADRDEGWTICLDELPEMQNWVENAWTGNCGDGPSSTRI